MLELLNESRYTAIDDNSDLAFPTGTPFKGIIRSVNFVNGDTLATMLGFTLGTPHNANAGWLHFIEDTGLEVYVAKKTLRYNISWEQLVAAAGTGNKEVTINGDVYVVQNLTALKPGASALGDANGGGDWNRYILGVYNGVARQSANWPAGIPIWGPYTETMLGVVSVKGQFGNGNFSFTREVVPGSADHTARGYSSVAGTPDLVGVWFQVAGTVHPYYGWRPVLIKKSTIPLSAFRGEVTAASFITPTALATAVSLSTGTLLNNSSPWMHFINTDGSELYFPKLPIRSNISWEQLSALGLVTGTKIITVGGRQFKVRLFLGATADPGAAMGREWNTYMLGLTNGIYGAYVATDFGIDGGATAGQLSICQEVSTSGGHVAAGYPTLSSLWYQNPNVTNGGYGWRPILELYVPPPPTPDTFELFATMPIPLYGHSMVEIAGKLYIYGGVTTGSVINNRCWEIDIATKTITEKAPGPLARRYQTAVAYNGKMYVYGGFTDTYTGAVVVYNPSTNTWATAFPAGEVGDRQAAVVYNNLMVVTGGLPATNAQLATVRRYNLATDTWTTANQGTNGYLLSAVLEGNLLHVMGGYQDNRNVVYNLDTGAAPVVKTAMPSARYGHVAGLSKGGIFVIGGTAAGAGESGFTFRYDLTANTWAKLGATPVNFGDQAACAQVGDAMYISGGAGSQTTIYKYNM